MGTFAGNRLKKFHSKPEFPLDRSPNLDQKEVPNLENFLANNKDVDFFDLPDDMLVW